MGTQEVELVDVHHGSRPSRKRLLALGRDAILKKDEIVTVANYVRSLSGLSTAPGFDAAAGKKIFDNFIHRL